MAASWPTSVASDSTLYIAVNELQNNLSGAINSAVTTIGLNSTTGFPTVGLVLIDNEVIQYGGISGNNLTSCTRAFDGTTAASHSSAAVVSFAFCAAHHNNLKDEIEAIETYLSANLGTGATPLSASTALVTNASKKIISSSVTAAELAFLSGVTSAIQTQITANGAAAAAAQATADAALPKVGGTMSGNIAMGVHKLTGLSAGTTSGDSVRFEQLFGPFQAPVQGTTTGTTSNSTTNYGDTGLTATITPTSASHRIKVTVCANGFDNTGAFTTNVTLARAGTNLLGAAGFGVTVGAGTNQNSASASYCYIDSPATTSPVTYTTQIKSSSASGTARSNAQAMTQTIILEEIV